MKHLELREERSGSTGLPELFWAGFLDLAIPSANRMNHLDLSGRTQNIMESTHISLYPSFL